MPGYKMVGKCIVSTCGNAASKFCGSCGVVRYCSIECQKDDWKKLHKREECVNMKKLFSKTLTSEQIDEVIKGVSRMADRLLAAGESESIINLLKECIDFTRDHLGRLNRKNSHSSVEDGVKVNDMRIIRLLVLVGQLYANLPRSPENDRHAISYSSEARELLMQLRDAGLNDVAVWRQLHFCDTNLHHIYSETGQMEEAKHLSVQIVANARQYNGPDHVLRLIRALQLLSTYLLIEQLNVPEALAASEEAYIIASKHYSPAHEKVLKASCQMIECLIVMEDYSTADTYCRMNYSNLFDPMNAMDYDPDDKIDVMTQLAKIWMMKEPDDDKIVEKALADEAIDFSRKAYVFMEENCRSTRHRLICLHTLCQVLVKAIQLTEETEGLLHQLVTISMTEKKFDGFLKRHPLVDLHIFYASIHDFFPKSEKSILVDENIESCKQRLLEISFYTEDSIFSTKGSHIINPYFESNIEYFI